MKFGPVSTQQAAGAILAHSLVLSSKKRLRKGTILSAEDIALIEGDGISSVIVAKPENDDVLEDAAATTIADLIRHETIRADEAKTGRVNFFATEDGIFSVSKGVVDAINAVDPTITFATLDDHTEVNAGRIIATVKIIPYAVSKASIDAIVAIGIGDCFCVKPYSRLKIGLISTELLTTKASIIRKTRQNLEHRLSASRSVITHEKSIGHDPIEVSETIAEFKSHVDMLILFGASAICDINDVIPEGIRTAGGRIIRFGMPVDPGNLLLIGEIDDLPVIGAPGCARSIAENGFDWVLQRALAGIPLSEIDIVGMGVGGLLMETGSRPHPRTGAKSTQGTVNAIVLAAGQSRRMGSINKMTVDIDGKPMVRHVVEHVVDAGISKPIVVTGHQPDEVTSKLEGISFVRHHNPDFERGLSTSLSTGISNLPEGAGAALILLGDMPFVDAGMIRNLLKAAEENPDHIIVSTHDGKRGNPVIWPSRFFEELQQVKGDVGAKHIIGANPEFVFEVEIGEAASADLDTPDAVNLFRNRNQN